MCIKGGFSSENIPQFLAPRWVTGWLSWESTSEGLIGRTGFGEHKRYLIPSVEWGSALIWVLISSTYSGEEWTGTTPCLKFVPSYCIIAIYLAVLRDDNMGSWIGRLYLQSCLFFGSIRVWNGHWGVFMWAEWTVADLVTPSPHKKGRRDKIRPSSWGHLNTSHLILIRKWFMSELSEKQIVHSGFRFGTSVWLTEFYIGLLNIDY